MRVRTRTRARRSCSTCSTAASDILVGEDVMTATKGDLAIVAPNTMHAFSATKGHIADLLILFSPAIDRFDYFRLLKKVVDGEANISEVLASQERFDNWFSDSAAWTAHRRIDRRRERRHAQQRQHAVPTIRRDASVLTGSS